MKKILTVIVVVMVLLLTLSVASCALTGVSKEEYDKVVAERDGAKAQVTSLQSELSEVEAESQSFEGLLAKAAVYAEALQAANAMGEETTEEESIAVWNKIEATGDEELKAKWQTMGELWQKSMEGEATEEEAMAAWMEWLDYAFSQLFNILTVE